ncbi:MAG: hypothetical protein ACKOYM_08705, partial [Actinomycetes bacterium]
MGGIMKKCVLSVLVVALAAIGLAAGCAPTPPPVSSSACSGFSSSLGQCVNARLPIGTGTFSADWYIPTAPASALMLLQHGFSRGCGNLRGTSKSVMERGLMVVCVNADMTGGNPNLGIALGDALADRTVVPPQGRPLPTKYIVGGHSAGGHFASAVGARLASRGYAFLQGAVLFDPVAQDGFSANVAAISAGGTRPVLSVAARPSVINLTNNSFGGLASLASTFVGVQLVWSGYNLGLPYGGSCHTDVEGENGDLVGNTAALCTPSSTQTARLRTLAANWARD